MGVGIVARKHLDIRMSAGKGRRVRIVERPGLWMKQEALDDLVGALRLIASRTLQHGDLTYGIFSGDRSRLERTIITLVTDKRTGAPIAFNALPVMDLELEGRPIELLHLGLVMVDPGERGKGLSWVLYGLTCFLLFFRNQMRPLWVSNVTQVPAIVGMVAETFGDVFPTPGGNRRSFRHLLLARQIMASNRYVFGVGGEAGFDEERFVISNAYTGGSDGLKKTFDEAAKHRNAIYNDFCARELDYERGDDVLQIGRLDLGAARKYLTDMVPKQAWAVLAVAVAAAVVQRLALPVVHWFDDEREWGRLRARRVR